MEKVIIALVSVLLGGVIAIAKEVMVEKWKKKKEAEYLAIRVICILIDFIDGCVDVVHDDGTCQGQYPQDGCAAAQVSLPEINFDSIDVNWKSIPAHLMYKLLSLPSIVKNAIGEIVAMGDVDFDPPENYSYFHARQSRYADLGIIVFDLVQELRTKYQIKENILEEKWNQISVLRKKKIDSQK